MWRTEEEAARESEPEDREEEECYRRNSFHSDVYITLTDQQQLWLPYRACTRLGLTTFRRTRGAAHESPPFPEELLVVNGYRKNGEFL